MVFMVFSYSYIFITTLTFAILYWVAILQLEWSDDFDSFDAFDGFE